MITSKLKSFIYSKKIRRAVSNKAILDYRNLGKIGLITDAEGLEKKEKLFQMYKLLQLEEKDLKIVVSGSGIKAPEEKSFEILDGKGISVSGEFKAKAIQDFAQKEFDFLICYFSKENLAGSLLAAVTNSRVKFGNKPDDYGIYDVEINSGSLDEYLEEIKKYYKILKKKN